MKKYFLFMASVLTVILFNGLFFGTAEATRVAIVPIQIDEQNVERVSDFTTYYWDIMIEKFKYPDYELMDDEKIAIFVPEEGLKEFSKETLIDLSTKADAEIVVAMRLDTVKESPLTSRQEPMLETFMRGEFALYNRLTDKYFFNKIYDKDEIEEVLTLRNDWQHQVFTSELKRNLNRGLDYKVIKKKKKK